MKSLLKDGRTQPFPDNYNYNNEQDRLGCVGNQWTRPTSPARE